MSAKQIQSWKRDVESLKQYKFDEKILDGRRQVAHLIEVADLFNTKLIEEVEEHQALREKHHRALSKAEEIHLEWADLSKKQLDTIEELQKVLRMLRQDAEMALNGEWEVNQEGFEAQIKVIDEVLCPFHKKD